LKDILENLNYRLTIVPSGTEGVKQILAADFDAIVCDMVMPNFPGDKFYLAVQQARPISASVSFLSPDTKATET